MGGGGNKGWERDSAWFTHWEGEMEGGIHEGEENGGRGGRRNYTIRVRGVISFSYSLLRAILTSKQVQNTIL